ncbi:myocardin-related transcription factor B isoform X1 [Labrus bergylta]|uniref:myocardin-related transcription factor B isoform X1 n=1 Tax=Labrus bergylta TaxID=56723 RepID=UPI0033142AF0
MGLQNWLPSKSPLSSMACLDVETPSIYRGKFKSVLQLCLQQRRSREQLVEQGIMPPLKSPAAFHEQIRSLERARTGNFLKHKLCSRPERSQLVRMHILQETQAQPSLQATQMKLKRVRLADDLNEKIAQRPGAMELVEKNILPVDSAVEEVINGGETKKQQDVYNFDEESSDALSPKQPDSQQSPRSTSTSPRESEATNATSYSSQLNSRTQQAVPPNSPSRSDVVNLVSTNENVVSSPQPINTSAPSTTPGPMLVKQSLPKLPSERSRSKRSKESKPRVKKLKYHQYIPPDQKQELNEVPMDSAYARLLQQQQQFLQLQILSQQQQQYNYQSVLPATPKATTEAQTSCSSVVVSANTASTPVQPWNTQTNRRPDYLPSNLDEMKVAELKMELKLRSLPVSGTKTDLIERLKSFQESSNIQTAAMTETIPEASQSEKLTSPVSPITSKVSNLGIDDCSSAESPTKLSGSPSPTHTACVNSPQRAPPDKSPIETFNRDSERDKRLHEKERQIEELMRRLEQEQRLVEELKMQLEVEKRSQQGDSPPQLSPLSPLQVKEENRSPSGCCHSPCLPVVIKQEEAEDQSHLASHAQLIINHQTETLQPVQTEAEILLPASFPANSITLHTTVSSAATGLLQPSGQMPQKIEASAALQQQCRTQTDPLTKSSSLSQPTLTLQQPKSTNHVSKCKDPPRYEDAVKQTRGMLTAIQAPTAASQQMDDLFDVLIESGEISPFIRQDPPSQDKPLPVTACVTTLPINTVSSRPPPLVQVAQLPTPPLSPSTSLAALASNPKLETLLDNYHAIEPRTLGTMEELQPPPVAMEVDLIESTSLINMDWLDLTMSVAGGGVNSLEMSAPVGVFSSDFLNSHELHLNWD